MKIFLFSILFLTIFFGIFAYNYQGKLLFFPGEDSFGDCDFVQSLNFKATTVQHGGTSIRFYERRTSPDKPWLLFFHGNGQNACGRLGFSEPIKELGFNFAFLEYPGYGQDTQQGPSENSFLITAIGLLQHIKKSAQSKIYLYGESLGTGVATFVASKIQVDGLILQSPYPSITKMANLHFPLLPASLLLMHKFKAEEWAKEVDTKVLIFIGEEDHIIPPSFSTEQVKNFNKIFKVVHLPGHHHNDIRDAKLFWSELFEFFQTKE